MATQSGGQKACEYFEQCEKTCKNGGCKGNNARESRYHHQEAEVSLYKCLKKYNCKIRKMAVSLKKSREPQRINKNATGEKSQVSFIGVIQCFVISECPACDYGQRICGIKNQNKKHASHRSKMFVYFVYK